MPWKCPVCGAENPDDVDRCVVCGTPRMEGGEAEALRLEEPRSSLGGAEEQAPESAGEISGGEEVVKAEAMEAGVEAEVAGESAVERGAVEAGVEAAPPPPSGRYVLVVVNSPDRELIGRKIPLLFEAFGKISVGRSLENVIVVPDASVSRRHAILILEDGRLYIEDLGSTNGTYIYSREESVFKKVEGREELKPGDLVRLGHGTIFRVEVES